MLLALTVLFGQMLLALTILYERASVLLISSPGRKSAKLTCSLICLLARTLVAQMG